MKWKLRLFLFSTLLLHRRQLFAFESLNSFLPAKDLNDNCNRLNHDYLRAIAQFYDSVNLISIVAVHSSHETNARSTELPSALLKALPQEISCSVTFKVINAESLTNLQLNRANLKTDSGIIILAEHIFTIDKFIVPLSRYFTRIRRQKVILMVTNAHDTDFDALANDILKRFFQRLKIVNIILITPCSNDPKTIHTYFPFELNTVNNSTEWGVSKSVPINDFRLKNTDSFAKFHNFNGHPLRISFFRRYPTSIHLSELSQAVQKSRILKDVWRVENFTGMDGFMLSSFVEKFNFTPILSKPRDGDFGYRNPDGRFLGSIGDVLNEKTRISLIGHFLTDYGTNELEFLAPYFFDKLCIVAPKAPKIPEWMAIFQCYDESVWLALLAMNCICSWFWMMLKQARVRWSKNRKRSQKIGSHTIRFIVVDMWFMILDGPFKKVASHLNERLFIGTCLFANVILVGTFQSSLKSALTTVTHFNDIQTLQQLDDRGLPIGTSSGSLQKVFGSMENVFGERNLSNSVIRSLQQKYIRINSTNPALDRVAFDRNICCIERLSDVKVILSYKYRSTDGSSPLHIIEECLRTFYLAYIVKKGSILQPLFSVHVQRLFEGGFVTFWYDYIEYAITTHRRYIRLLLQNDKNGLSLVDLQVAFFILFIGLLMASILFVIEIAVYRYQKRTMNGVSK